MKSKVMVRGALVALLYLLAAAAPASESSPVLVGRVTRVVDGDTIEVKLDSGPIRVRLHAIDAPEEAQPYGKEATAMAAPGACVAAIGQAYPGSSTPQTIVAATSKDVGDPTSFHCDGRIRCADMTSCGEAEFFLKHCPEVKMDGDGDGIPCEKLCR